MSIAARRIKNKKDAYGMPTGRGGNVYDVTFRYRTEDGYKSYGKRGFLCKRDAKRHQAEMQLKFTAPNYLPINFEMGRQRLDTYLRMWLELHGSANLRPATIASYRQNINCYISPILGEIPLVKLTGPMIDHLLAKLLERGLSTGVVRHVQRTLSVALEHARKYRYIESNPVRDILTKLQVTFDIPDPYTIPQMSALLAGVAGTKWEMPVVLGGLFGLRLGEVLGLRWENVDLEHGILSIVEQLPYDMPAGTTHVTEMAPVKSKNRYLPITALGKLCFKRQKQRQITEKAQCILGQNPYYNNDLVVCLPDGSPYRKARVSNDFRFVLRRLDMPHIRFHDLRHTAASNMFQLTGDFFTVGMLLGHGIPGMHNITTARYVDVRMEQKAQVMGEYHEKIAPPVGEVNNE